MSETNEKVAIGSILHKDEAFAAVECIEEPSVRDLVKMATVSVFVEYMHKTGQSDRDLAHQAPASDFDLLFFVRVMRRNFSRPRAIAKHLGLTVEEYAEVLSSE